MIINGTNITMMRGDSESLTISMQNDANPPVAVPFEAGDTVILTVKGRVGAEPVLRKVCTVFDEGKAIFEFLPTDTEALIPKVYLYDVEYRSATGRVKTIINPAAFTVKGDVTEPGDKQNG